MFRRRLRTLERAQLEAAELGKSGVFLELREVAESRDSVRGDVLCMFALAPQWDCWQWNTGTETPLL